MRGFVWIFALLVSGFTAQMAFADSTSKDVFESGDWHVRAVQWDDGTSACVAEVNLQDDTFSIWADKTNPIRLQFYSSEWNFGDSDSDEDLEVQIDENRSWNLNHADLYKNSILFDLPGGNDSTQFLHEIANGGTLHLDDNSGKEIRSYSLSGAEPSIGALNNCVDGLH